MLKGWRTSRQEVNAWSSDILLLSLESEVKSCKTEDLPFGLFVCLFTFWGCSIKSMSGRRGGSVVSALDWRPEGREFEPWPVHPRCALRQNI